MKVLDFRSALKLAAAAMFMLTLLILAACSEDESKVDPVTVEFVNAAQTIAEEGGAKNITLALGGAAKKDGTLTISASPDNAHELALFPTEINVTKGSTFAQFVLTPMNNAIIDANAKVITFTIEDMSSGFTQGEQTTLAVTITDDEGPTTANFTVESGNVAENASTGINVEMTLSPAAEVAGTIEVTMTPADADVATTPAAATGKITVPVAVGQTAVSFSVLPNDNEDDGDDFEVAFKITNASGGVLVGTNVDYTLTVIDDDDILPTPIADVRDLYSGTGTLDITQPLLIQGIVTSSNPQVNSNNIWVQDASGGVALRFVSPNNNTIKRGDEVIIDLQGARFANFNGLVQIENVANTGKVTLVDENNTLPAPETVTLAQLKTNDYQGKLVAVQNVRFVDSDGVLTMNGTRAITDGTETVNVRTESGAPFSGNLMPLGSGRVAGLAAINASVIQIIPIVFADDVFANNPVGTIGTTSAMTDFGSVNTGAESADQSYTVQGTTLSHDIIITASAGFKIALTQGGTYGASVTIPAVNANSATTVYVKFAPAVGGAQSGTLTHKSQDAATVVVNVSGIGVGLNPLESLALWTFESSTYGSSTPNKTGTESDVFTAEGGVLSSSSTAKGVHAAAVTVYTSPAGNGSTKSLSSNNWVAGDYYQFTSNSTGYHDIKISWDQTGSNTGPGSFVLQYSTDGTNFTQFGTAYTVINDTWAIATPKTTTSYSVDLSSVTTLNNSPTLVFRLAVATGSPSINGGAIAATGTGRIDNVKIEGRQ